MPFIESVPTTEYRIAVNLAPSSLSDPCDNPLPIAGARKILSASLSPIADYSRIVSGPADSRAIERKMPE